jgi:hypothetical protein
MVDQPLGAEGAVEEPELTATAISSWKGADEDGVQLFVPLHVPPREIPVPALLFPPPLPFEPPPPLPPPPFPPPPFVEFVPVLLAPPDPHPAIEAANRAANKASAHHRHRINAIIYPSHRPGIGRGEIRRWGRPGCTCFLAWMQAFLLIVKTAEPGFRLTCEGGCIVRNLH